MKTERILKITFVVLLIILISLISFGGIFIQNTKFIENIIPNYKLGRDLTGGRVIDIIVSQEKNEVIYDKDGNVVEEEGKDTTKKEEPVNPESSLTEENYKNADKIFRERLEKLGASDYTLRFDEKTGKEILTLPEDSQTDVIAQYTIIKGEFKIEDDDGNVLINNSQVKNAQVGYRTDEEGTVACLNIYFNEEGTEKLKEISNTYIKTTDEDGKEQTKNINLKIDDTTLMSTYFSEEISNGVIQLSIGSATTSNETLNSYLQEASQIAVLINTGTLPLTYTMETNRYVMSDVELESLKIPAIVVIALIAVGILFLIWRYRKNGVLASISFIGYIATFLLVIRYTNVIITLEGIVGVLIAIILSYIFSVYLLHLLKNKQMKTTSETVSGFKEALLHALYILVPVAVTSIVLCFSNWLPANSFGMTAFWGVFVSVLYNLIITRTLIVSGAKSK